jgi:hypothetical protein
MISSIRRVRLLLAPGLVLSTVVLAAIWLPRPAPDQHGVSHRPVSAEAFRPHRKGRPLLIKHGWDIPSPSYVRHHVKRMERMPFDGVVIGMPRLSTHVQKQSSVRYQRFRKALAPVASTRFTTLTHNFVMVYATPSGRLFRSFSIPVHNFARLARAARGAGFEGIAYDNESYFGGVWNRLQVCPDHSLRRCRARARRYGRQVMDAMRKEWPSIHVLAFYGPWVSDPLTARHFKGSVPYNDTSRQNDLLGSFFVGMAQSTVGTRAKVIDGGEIFGARTQAQFVAVHHWQVRGMPATSAQIPRSLRRVWPDTISAGVGVYDGPYDGAGMNVGSWRRALTNALRVTDRYVWVNTERFDWWGTGWPRRGVPRAWVRATRQARASAVRGPRRGAALEAPRRIRRPR